MSRPVFYMLDLCPVTIQPSVTKLSDFFYVYAVVNLVMIDEKARGDILYGISVNSRDKFCN